MGPGLAAEIAIKQFFRQAGGRGPARTNNELAPILVDFLILHR